MAPPPPRLPPAPPPVAQPQVASASNAQTWPERLEQPQGRPIESEQYVYVHGIRYQKLDLAGKGGSSKVYKVCGLGSLPVLCLVALNGHCAGGVGLQLDWAVQWHACCRLAMLMCCCVVVHA